MLLVYLSKCAVLTVWAACACTGCCVEAQHYGYTDQYRDKIRDVIQDFKLDTEAKLLSLSALLLLL